MVPERPHPTKKGKTEATASQSIGNVAPLGGAASRCDIGFRPSVESAAGDTVDASCFSSLVQAAGPAMPLVGRSPDAECGCLRLRLLFPSITMELASIDRGWLQR